MRGTEANCRLEIVAHPHAEMDQRVSHGDLLEQREMRRGLGAEGRNAHQSAHRQFQRFAAQADEGVGLGGQDAGLLRLFSRIHLDEEMGPALTVLELGL